MPLKGANSPVEKCAAIERFDAEAVCPVYGIDGDVKTGSNRRFFFRDGTDVTDGKRRCQ